MASNSLNAFYKKIEMARDFREGHEQKEYLYFASIAYLVSAWDFYIKEVIKEYFGYLSLQGDVKFRQISSITSNNFQSSLKTFNTPNFEKARDVLTRYTGYDPLVDWNWTRRGIGWIVVSQEFNMIFKIRHSFAHGLSYPSGSLISGYSGAKIRKKDVLFCESLILHLARSTDKGLSRFSTTTFGFQAPW